MPANKRFRVPFKIHEIIVRFYLLLITFHFFFGTAYLVNLLIDLTVDRQVGLYFEFVSASADRFLVYLLIFITMFYVAIKSQRKMVSLSLLFISIFVSYFAFMQTVDVLMVFISFTLLTWLLAGPKPFTVMKRGETVSLAVIYLVLILVSIEFLSLICWFIFQLFPILSEEGIFRYLAVSYTHLTLPTKA